MIFRNYRYRVFGTVNFQKFFLNTTGYQIVLYRECSEVPVPDTVGTHLINWGYFKTKPHRSLQIATKKIANILLYLPVLGANRRAESRAATAITSISSTPTKPTLATSPSSHTLQHHKLNLVYLSLSSAANTTAETTLATPPSHPVQKSRPRNPSSWWWWWSWRVGWRRVWPTRPRRWSGWTAWTGGRTVGRVEWTTIPHGRASCPWPYLPTRGPSLLHLMCRKLSWDSRLVASEADPGLKPFFATAVKLLLWRMMTTSRMWVSQAAVKQSEKEVDISRPAIWSSLSRTAKPPSRLVSELFT